MSYWTAAQLQPGRQALALHMLAQENFTLAVRLSAIREAIEVAFGVRLPTAATLNAEFEIITSAIYAAADRPRPAPLTDDKRTTRTHFVYRIDIWTNDGKNIVEQPREPHCCAGGVSGCMRALAKSSYHLASRRQDRGG
jgi:hypothetical protein